jgi:hypothetical protein
MAQLIIRRKGPEPLPPTTAEKMENIRKGHEKSVETMALFATHEGYETPAELSYHSTKEVKTNHSAIMRTIADYEGRPLW